MRVFAAYLVLCLAACGPQAKPALEEKASAAMTGRITQIVAQWSDQAEFDDLIAIEDAIIEAAGDSFEVDGHDIGSGTFNVFIYADDAVVNSTVEKLVKLREAGTTPPGMKIGVAQYTDAKREDWTWKPVYPADLKSFELM